MMRIKRAMHPCGPLVFTLTPEEIEAAYRTQLHRYRLMDAEAHFTEMHGETDDFEDTYGFSADDACNPEHSAFLLEDFVRKYEHDKDCNIAESDMWEACIEQVLKEVRPEDVK